MPVTDLLERNHKLYSDEVALVELNPLIKDTRKTTWKEYDLIQQTSPIPYRREITWGKYAFEPWSAQRRPDSHINV